MAYNQKNLAGLSSKAVKCESPERRLEQGGPAPLATASLNTPSVTVESGRVSVSSPCARNCMFALLQPDEGGSKIRMQDHIQTSHNNQPAPSRQVCGGEDGVCCDIADIDVSSNEDKGVVRKRLYISTLPRVRYLYHHVDGKVTRHKSLSGSRNSSSSDDDRPISVAFGVNAQLNGSHGEVTNTDDMATPANKTLSLGGDGKTFLPDLERSRREAQNHQHSSNAGSVGRRKKRKQKKKESSDVSVVSEVLSEVSPTQVVVPHEIVLKNVSYVIYVDYSTSKGAVRLLPDGVFNDYFYCLLPGDTVSNVIKENYGWYEIDATESKGKSLVAASPFQVVALRSIKIDDKWTDAREGLVFMPLLSKLRQEFRNARGEGPISQSLVSAIKNVTGACKNICDLSLPDVVRTWFFDLCDNTESVYRLQVLESFAQSNLANNLFLPASLARHTNMRQRHGVVNRVSTVDVPMSKLNEEYDIKLNIQIKHKGQVRALTKEFWFREKPWPLEQEVVLDDQYKPGKATHKWICLTDTIRYSFSANNLYGAASRIFKSRDNELIYQRNQANLCIALHAHYGLNDVWKTLNVKFNDFATNDCPHGSYVSQYPYLPPIVYAEGGLGIAQITNVYKQSISQYSELIKVCDYLHTLMRPTLSESVVDFAQNTLVQAKVAAYTLFSSCQVPLLWRTQYAHEPHVKKLERIKILGSTVMDGTGCLVSKVSVNVKDEIAKNGGKMPRAFVSYGSGVLCAPTIPITFKERINGWHYFDIGNIKVCVIIYAKPKSSELIELFEALVRARAHTGNHLCVAIYSDDSCYSGVVNRVPFGYNVDISSCDSSNGPPIFFLIASLMSKIDEVYARLLLEQCCKPMAMQHPGQKDLAYELLLPTAFEGSGTVLTTCLNHVASLLIAVSAAVEMSHGFVESSADIEKCIVAGACAAGHKVTVASIEVNGVLHNSKFQFLKISPMVCKHTITGEVRLLPVRNIGSVIKGFGQLSEDMQANQLSLDNATFNRMPYGDRMDCYLGAVMKGYRNEPSTPILTALRTRFNCATGTLKTKFTLVEEDIDFSLYEVLEEELYARYEVSDYQVVLHNLLDLQLGDNLQADPVLQQIMHVDYEYDAPSNDVEFSNFNI